MCSSDLLRRNGRDALSSRTLECVVQRKPAEYEASSDCALLSGALDKVCQPPEQEMEKESVFTDRKT